MNALPGIPLLLGPFQGRIGPGWNTPLALRSLENLRSALERPGAEVLLESQNRVAALKLRVSPRKSADIVVKEFRLRGVNRLKTLVLPSKAVKAWRSSWALVERGIATPAPVAYLERRERGRVAESYFLSERWTGVEEIRYPLRRLQGPALRRLLDALSVFLAEAHDRGVLHKDLSDGNVLVRKGKRGDYALALIDTNRVRIRRGLGPLLRIKNLIRLGIPREEQKYFLDRYWRGGRLPRALYLWYRARKACYTGYVSVKKELRLKSMARKLGVQ